LTVIGIQNIGARFYIIFAVINAFWLPFIYFLYPETAGLSLDDIDRVFELKFAPGAKLTYEEATVLAKEATERERQEIARQPRKSEKIAKAQHVEEVV
jgi:hypothetical protein